MIEMFLKLFERFFNLDKEELITIIRDSLYIVIISTLIGFAVNIFHPRGYTLVSTGMYKNKAIVMISGDEARIKYDSNRAIFIDSRSAAEYKGSHIPNAINIPAVPASISAKKINDNISILSQPKELVIYCDGASCGSSSILANRLVRMGYMKHIYIIENGIPDWMDRDFPLDKERVNNK